ncbi:MAG TPA: ribose-phosphate diphosphokinase [Sandaracinaceae bacterium LLY-WYZ-13_1]|nr:ribose-phosphate diphosphokinase [Sandaracinaceae bacterium LLY-WYZ-13_1]
MTEPRLLYSTAEYAYLRDALLGDGLEAGTVERTDFPDGERLLRVIEDVDGRDVVLVGGTTDDAATLELYDLASGLVTYGARRLTLVIPYLGYSTMERAIQPGEIVTAKNRARLLSSIPPASYGNRMLLLDLHSEGIPHYFEGEITAFHVYAKAIIKDAARELAGDDFVMACTDAGRAKWVESLANDLGVTAAFVFKRRLSGTETEVLAASARVEGRTVVIYDDMIRTGGSLVQAGQAYRDAGASRIFAVATHGLFPGDALERLRGCGLFERLVVTDSHPRARALGDHDDFLEVRGVASVFGGHL